LARSLRSAQENDKIWVYKYGYDNPTGLYLANANDPVVKHTKENVPMKQVSERTSGMKSHKKMRLAEPATVSNSQLLKPPYVGGVT